MQREFWIPISLILAAGGCQQVGPKSTLTPNKSEVETGSPVTLSTPEGIDGLATANGTGSGNRTSLKVFDKEGNPTSQADDLSIGGSQSTFILPTGPNSPPAMVRSGKDSTLKVAKLTQGDTVIEGLEVSAIASEATRATNEAYAQLTDYWKALSADQRAARIAELEAASKAGDTFAPVILSLIKAAMGVP